MVRNIYAELKRYYSKKYPEKNYVKWWPVSQKFQPAEWEICIGAVLTQNTNWKNVVKVLDNLHATSMTTPEKLASAKINVIEGLVQPSGFYRQKAATLKNLARFFMGNKKISRHELLKQKGIGPETADSILLYALNRKTFIIDAYTKRLFSRLGVTAESDYAKLKDFFESHLAKISEYKEFHALIVEHSKAVCKKEPECEKCFLNNKCKFGSERIL